MSSISRRYLLWRVSNEFDNLEGPDDIAEDVNIDIDI